MSAATKQIEQSRYIEFIEQDLERMWDVLSADEKMTNEKLTKRFGTLRQMLATLRDLSRHRKRSSKAV